MEEWLRFSVVYWHTFRGTGADPFGFPTLKRPWDDGTESIDNAKRRLRVAFEFFKRLGVKYYTFHDRLVELLLIMMIIDDRSPSERIFVHCIKIRPFSINLVV